MNISRLGAFLIPLSVFVISPARAEATSARQTELLYLVRQDCGSCHGLRMEGGLGVPLTPKALKGKDVEGLKLTILQGRPGTTMPPWNPFISEAEAGWIVDMLIKGLPDAH